MTEADYPFMGAVRVMLPIALNFAPNHIFGDWGWCNSMHRKCRVLIDTEVNDRLPPKVSRDIFKFWVISHNISEKMQHKDIVAMED